MARLCLWIWKGHWNNPCSSGYQIIPHTHRGVEGMRLLAHAGMYPTHHRHVWAGEPKALVTTGSGEVGMCHSVHSFPEHLGTLHISNLFFTWEDVFFCNWKIKACFCSVSTEDTSNSMLKVGQAAITFKWSLAGPAYLHRRHFFGDDKKTFWSLLWLGIVSSEKRLFQFVASSWYLFVWSTTYVLEEFSCVSGHGSKNLAHSVLCFSKRNVAEKITEFWVMRGYVGHWKWDEN